MQLTIKTIVSSKDVERWAHMTQAQRDEVFTAHCTVPEHYGCFLDLGTNYWLEVSEVQHKQELGYKIEFI